MLLISKISACLDLGKCAEALKLLQEHAQKGYPIYSVACTFYSIVIISIEILSSNPSLSDVHNVCIFTNTCQENDFLLSKLLGANNLSLPESKASCQNNITPSFSIIMPTYNRYPLFLSSIYSALIQDHSSFELIIADDCSTDSTSKFMGFFSAITKNLKYIRSSNNSGAAAARNNAFSISSGKYISFLDSDNLWKYNYLSSADKIMRDNTHMYRKYLDCVLDPTTNHIIKAEEKGEPFYYERLCVNNYIDLNSYVIRRKYFQLIGGFHSNLKRRQDWQLLLKSSWAIKPYFDTSEPRVLYQRNQSWEQISHLQARERESRTIASDTINSSYDQKSHYPIISEYATTLGLCFDSSTIIDSFSKLSSDNYPFFNISPIFDDDTFASFSEYKILGMYYFLGNHSRLEFSKLLKFNMFESIITFFDSNDRISPLNSQPISFKISNSLCVLFSPPISSPSPKYLLENNSTHCIIVIDEKDKNFASQDDVLPQGVSSISIDFINLEDCKNLHSIKQDSLVICCSKVIFRQIVTSNFNFFINLADCLEEGDYFDVFNLNPILGSLIHKTLSSKLFHDKGYSYIQIYVYFCGNFVQVSNHLLLEIDKINAANYRYVMRNASSSLTLSSCWLTNVY